MRHGVQLQHSSPSFTQQWSVKGKMPPPWPPVPPHPPAEPTLPGAVVAGVVGDGEVTPGVLGDVTPGVLGDVTPGVLGEVTPGVLGVVGDGEGDAGVLGEVGLEGSERVVCTVDWGRGVSPCVAEGRPSKKL